MAASFRSAARKRHNEPVRIRLKRNDQVKVIAGRDKGKTGRVLDINEKTGRILVEHCGMIKRHTRPNPSKQIKGGIAEKEGFIAVSNVMVLDSQGKPGRIGAKVEDLGNGKVRRTRISRKSGQSLDKK
jgi:large subunit ribosomal protein L24